MYRPLEPNPRGVWALQTRKFYRNGRRHTYADMLFWDKSRTLHVVLQGVRLYDAPRNHTRASYSQQVPVLDAAYQDDSRIFLGGLDGIVKR